MTEYARRSTVFLLFLSRSADGTSVGRNLGPEIGALLGDGSGDTRSLHLTSVVNNHTSIILKIQKVSFSPTDGFLLTDDDSGHDLLSELGLTLLDRGEEHVADRASGESVELSSSHANCNHMKVLGSGVVTTVHHRCDGKTV